MTTGLAAEKSSSATQMIFSQVLFATLMDWLIWRVVPNVASITGGSLLIISISAVLFIQGSEESRTVVREVLDERSFDEELDLECLIREDNASGFF